MFVRQHVHPTPIFLDAVKVGHDLQLEAFKIRVKAAGRTGVKQTTLDYNTRACWLDMSSWYIMEGSTGSMGSSPASTTAGPTSSGPRIGRPPQWTVSRSRKLARLYLYSTLPIDKIIKVLADHGFSPRKNSAQKTIHKMLDNDPRYLRPESRVEMTKRISSLAMSLRRRKRKGAWSSDRGSRQNSGEVVVSFTVGWTGTLTERQETGLPSVAGQSIKAEDVTNCDAAFSPEAADVRDIQRRVSDCSTTYAVQLATLVRKLTISVSSSNASSRRASVASSHGDEPMLIFPTFDAAMEAYEPFPDPGYALPGDFLTAHTRSCADFPGQRHGTACWCSIARETVADPNSWLLPTGELSERAKFALTRPGPPQLSMRDGWGNSPLHLLATLEGFREALLGMVFDSDGAGLWARNTGGQTFLHVLHVEWFSDLSGPAPPLRQLLTYIRDVCPDLVYEADVYGRTFFHRAQSVLRDVDLLQSLVLMFDPAKASRRDAFGSNPVADTDAASQKPYVPPRCTDMSSPPRDMISTVSDADSGDGSFLAYHVRLVQVICSSYADPTAEDAQGRNGLHCLAEAILNQQTMARHVRSSSSSSSHGRPNLKRRLASSDTVVPAVMPSSPLLSPSPSSFSSVTMDSTEGAALPTRLRHLQTLLLSVAIHHYDLRGRTPLMAFVEELSDDQDDRERTLRTILETLLRAPASRGYGGTNGSGGARGPCIMEARNRRGETALLVAARLGRKVALTALLEHGANVYARDAAGRGVLEVLDDEGAGEGLVWVMALCLAVASTYQAEVGPVWLLPALPPLVYAYETRLRPDPRLRATRVFLATMSVGALLTVLALLALRYWSVLEFALSAIPAAALLVVYVAAVPRPASSARQLPRLPDLQDVGSLGTKASSTSWSVAPAIMTFGLLASRHPAIHPSEWHALATVLAAFITLVQITLFLPKTKGRLLLLGLALLPLGPYAADMARVRRVRSYHLGTTEHPVQQLVRNARDDFHRMLERQSKTYSEAVAEYKRRYGVDPPPGFEAWYGAAAEIQSPIIDEFDGIYRSLLPFWRLSGRDVASLMASAQRLPDTDLWTCTFSSATAVTNCTHPWRTFDRHFSDMFNHLLGGLREGVLPRDVTFLINHLDEPAVVFPRSANPGKPITVTNLAGRSTWDAITWSCGIMKHKNASRVETYGLPFVTNATQARNLCANPDYAHQHGLFISPASFRLIEGRVPILSTGAPSTMADILFPSPAHVVEPEFRYGPNEPVVPWDRKQNNLYWAGADTGGVITGSPKQWRQFHCQRFISLAQNVATPTDHIYLSEVTDSSSSTPRVVPISTPFLNTHLYRVHPTKLHTCSSSSSAARIACLAQRSTFRLLGRQPSSASYTHKLAFDLDGNGISGRFPRLLASGSLVLKQVGGLREWWNDGDNGEDGRVRAWVHYVPVSMDMGELPELVHFLLETERGRELAKEVAEEGRKWVGKAMREVDVKLWVWRLVLELARVSDPEREPLV
ncbi:hypothetical protein VTJ49DRAFT_4072 [Mycothermus thermophilus]|uniref:Glycosyl transferase CAP10 domain-containing protein n=1 Tax=Humicola insolens TaxID=85995 RepID=A0ABR3V723_HUMIN